MPSNQVEKTNKPSKTSHSNHKGSTSHCGWAVFSRFNKDFKTNHLSKIAAERRVKPAKACSASKEWGG
jgi:hypothetical protein